VRYLSLWDKSSSPYIKSYMVRDIAVQKVSIVQGFVMDLLTILHASLHTSKCARTQVLTLLRISVLLILYTLRLCGKR
jgi:hypothetical protein